MKKLTIYTDGASKGNPGDAGIGAVISTSSGQILKEISEYIGVTTNNAAEYRALIAALEAARELGAESIEICTDSELMARQLSGVYKVKSNNLKPFFDEAVSLLRKFSDVSISHVIREHNKRADELANLAIKRHKNNNLTNGQFQQEISSDGAPDVPAQFEMEF